MRPTKLFAALGFAVACAVVVPTVSAQTLAVSPASVNGTPAGGPTTPGSVALVYANAGSGLGGFQADLQYDNAVITPTPTPVTPSGHLVTCQVIVGGGPGGTNVIRIVVANLGGGAAADGTYCNIGLSVAAGQATGSSFPLTLASAVNVATLTNGVVNIPAGPPPDVVVTFTPASGSTIAFGGGAPGANVTQSIALGNTGTIGSGTVSGCVLSGADAGSFSITGGNPSTVPPATSIGLQATLGAAALSATLTCNVADASATTSVTWPLTAPAGTVLQAPTLASNPASGASITLPNSYGTPVTTPIAFTPTGGDAGGPNASVTCSTASAGFTVTPAGALTFTPPGGAAQNAVVGCTPGAAPIGGVVTCTGTHQGGAINWSYDVTCPAAQTAPPPPTFVPATSLWSKLALFGVFAALGMLILGLRRNH